MSRNRDYKKLVEAYKTKFFGAPPPQQNLCQIYLDDFDKIHRLAAESSGSALELAFNCTDIALQAGIMIGLEEGQRLRKSQARKGRKAAK